MEMNRHNCFMIGLLVLFFGIQMRMVDTFVLNEKTTKFLAERAQPAVADSRDFPSFLASTGVSGKKSIKLPPWIGFAMLSVGSVVVLHSLVMKKPGA